MCYGYGEKGHRLGRCPQIFELTKSGVLAYDNIGRITHGTSTRISRFQNKTIIEAAKCERDVIDATH